MWNDTNKRKQQIHDYIKDQANKWLKCQSLNRRIIYTVFLKKGDLFLSNVFVHSIYLIRSFHVILSYTVVSIMTLVIKRSFCMYLQQQLSRICAGIISYQQRCAVTLSSSRHHCTNRLHLVRPVHRNALTHLLTIVIALGSTLP